VSVVRGQLFLGDSMLLAVLTQSLHFGPA